MAIDLSKVPFRVLVDLRDQLGAPDEEQSLPVGQCSKDGEIAEYSKESLFDCWCDYEGLVHYGSSLRELWQQLNDAEVG